MWAGLLQQRVKREHSVVPLLRVGSTPRLHLRNACQILLHTIWIRGATQDLDVSETQD